MLNVEPIKKRRMPFIFSLSGYHDVEISRKRRAKPCQFADADEKKSRKNLLKVLYKKEVASYAAQ